MCGIAGTVGKAFAPGAAARMNAMLEHRGPDDNGLENFPEHDLTLAMRRLAVLDIEGGHQPMASKEGNHWIVFNGEIFNSPELRERLLAKGATFSTRNSDTELLLRLYIDRGTDMLDELNGMFAFVIYDKRKKLLFGARDPAGIKPFYYWSRAGNLAFASELKALLTLPEISRETETDALFHYLTLLHVPGDRSIIQGVRRLPPGHAFEFHLDHRNMRVFPFWEPTFNAEEGVSMEDWVERIRAELERACRRWTLSDAPLACSLSGGLDSSGIVSLLASEGRGKLRTYTVGFAEEEESEWNERHLARLTAERYGADHQEIVVQSVELLDDLPSMVWALDEPYGGGLPSWSVFREMSRDVKVGLTGTGGDELFGNYGKFAAYESSDVSLRPAGLGRFAARFARRICGGLPAGWKSVGRGRRIHRRSSGVLEPFGRNHHALRSYFTDEEKWGRILQPEHHSGIGTSEFMQNRFEQSSATNARDAVLAVDFGNQLPEEFLHMTDRMSMAHGLEARTPFLDREFVKLALSIPADQRTSTSDPKGLLRSALSGLLPPEIVNAPKRGFVLPIRIWLRERIRPVVERALAPERLRRQGIFKQGIYERYVCPHLEGRQDYTWRIWPILMFQIWHEIFIRRRETSVPVCRLDELF